jgi:hypothetical protein
MSHRIHSLQKLWRQKFGLRVKKKDFSFMYTCRYVCTYACMYVSTHHHLHPSIHIHRRHLVVNHFSSGKPTSLT